MNFSYKNFLYKFEFIKKAHNKFMESLSIDLVLEERKARLKEKNEIIEQYEKRIEELKTAHEFEIKFLKNQFERQQKTKEQQIAQEKRKLDEELKKAVYAQKQATKTEDKFVQSLLKFQELLHKVKKINESIQQLVIAEHGLEELIFEIENPSKKEQEKIDKIVEKEYEELYKKNESKN